MIRYEITGCNTPESAAEFKGCPAILTMTDGTTMEGTFLSVNSKGWNITVDGKTVSRGFNRVSMVQVDHEYPEMEEAIEIVTAGMNADDNDQDIFEDAADVAIAATDPEVYSDTEPGTDDNDALVAELDGLTSAALADMFGIAAKELRVTLRALGLGVGKGHRYHLKATEIEMVKAALTA